MKLTLLAGGAVTAIVLATSAASAAPIANLGKAVTGDTAGLIKVHGVHRECLRGRWGWHRSTPWGGRIVCEPHFRRWYGWEGRRHRHDDYDDMPAQPRRRYHAD